MIEYMNHGNKNNVSLVCSMAESCLLFRKSGAEMVTEICQHSKYRSFNRGQRLLSSGQRSDSVILICSGKVGCQYDGCESVTIPPGHCFGEMALYLEYIFGVCEEHQHLLDIEGDFSTLLIPAPNVISHECGTLLEIPFDVILKFIPLSPRLACNLVSVGQLQLIEAAHRRPQAEAAASLHPLAVAGFLRGVPAVQAQRVLSEVSDLCRLRIGPGQMVVEQGCVGDSVFVVLSGLYSCLVNGTEVRQFGPWEMFGEVTLCASFPDLVFRYMAESSEGEDWDLLAGGLRGRVGSAVASCGVRTADVVCLEPGELVEIPAAQMISAFQCSPKMFGNVYNCAEERFLEALSAGSLDAILRYQK